MNYSKLFEPSELSDNIDNNQLNESLIKMLDLSINSECDKDHKSFNNDYILKESSKFKESNVKIGFVEKKADVRFENSSKLESKFKFKSTTLFEGETNDTTNIQHMNSIQNNYLKSTNIITNVNSPYQPYEDNVRLFNMNPVSMPISKSYKNQNKQENFNICNSNSISERSIRTSEDEEEEKVENNDDEVLNSLNVIIEIDDKEESNIHEELKGKEHKGILKKNNIFSTNNLKQLKNEEKISIENQLESNKSINLIKTNKNENENSQINKIEIREKYEKGANKMISFQNIEHIKDIKINTKINTSHRYPFIYGSGKNKKCNSNLNYNTFNHNEIIKLMPILVKQQTGCRYLQLKLDENSNYAEKYIIPNIIDYLYEVLTDQFGNYLIQKIIESTSINCFSYLFNFVSIYLYIFESTYSFMYITIDYI